MARNGTAPLFSDTAAGTLRLIGYLALAVVLMVVDQRGGWLARLRYAGALVVEPVYRLAALPAALVQDARLAFVERRDLTEENRRLREALLLAQARLNRLGAVADQNQRLRELLDVRHSLGMNVQLARLLDIDVDPYRHRIVLDAGAREGVKAGQVVIDAHGVMGQVVEVLPHTAVAMLITDPNHAIPVTVERTGLRTVAYGTGAIDRLKLPTIPLSAHVRVGDKLVTSGLGGRFPAGFPVGEIVQVAPDQAGMFAVAVARPAAALDRSGEVLLLHDLAEPAGPPEPVPPVGPPAQLAPNTATAGTSP
ncbi:rod shape-determining protein MreC [Mizugakiibacter sediminis]|uniref:Cell shape-determining protein MreC n=1 Tax=Mizugakiibacter sediminis TaxID=1475481 RepID=A0A0K8QMS5_9GAMM|nr:rod shape-determining protein MreC [Mizugakiibacter sediminis]GAP66200.1 rod shape-determining protein MreC [Mizugakiibacter sediminis]